MFFTSLKRERSQFLISFTFTKTSTFQYLYIGPQKLAFHDMLCEPLLTIEIDPWVALVLPWKRSQNRPQLLFMTGAGMWLIDGLTNQMSRNKLVLYGLNVIYLDGGHCTNVNL